MPNSAGLFRWASHFAQEYLAYCKENGAAQRNKTRCLGALTILNNTTIQHFGKRINPKFIQSEIRIGGDRAQHVRRSVGAIDVSYQLLNDFDFRLSKNVVQYVKKKK